MGQSSAEHTLTLDGQADSDTYEVHTLGSNGVDQRNYVINVLDTGNAGDGADELSIFGFDSADNGIDPATGEKFTTDDIFVLRAASFLPNETADRPGYVAMLHGSVNEYLDLVKDNEDFAEVQRINYDTGLNGRLLVEGQGGNDAFYSDDTTVIVTLDGGAGDDSFQIGQVFGERRDQAEGMLLAQDVFTGLVPTTRGWLSPGISAPMVAQGGSGNDSFSVFANQAELRLEGDDDNDLFSVRAFALAAVSSKDWNNDGVIDANDLAAVDQDSNLDGVINFADADETPGDFTDDTILLDENGVAVPLIGSGFSVAQAPDIRAGGGDDEVQYNINAPASIEGGTGFDKLVILGTEFADDIVIDAQDIFGAGVNLSYSTVEVVEVDGLEGDDEFFVRSTAFGTAYRVIGGLGSDTINVAGDVTEDIVTRELEGTAGAIDHLLRSDDPLYQGLLVDGVDYNVADSTEGLVVIDESDGFTLVREGGPLEVDSYGVRLATALAAGEVVYVTVSASRSPQEERDNLLFNPPPLGNGEGDSLWLSASAPADPANPVEADFQRQGWNDGDLEQVGSLALVLTFNSGNWDQAQQVYVYAPDDTRAEGDRIVTIQHSVKSNVDAFDAVDVRNVEVQLLDNDTPGVLINEIEPGSFDPVSGDFIADDRSIVLEGASTGMTDELLVSLATAPEAGDSIVIKLNLDADSDQHIRLLDALADTRFDPIARTITFDSSNWDDAVLVGIEARDDARHEDPLTAVIAIELDASTIDTDGDYAFPNLRSGDQLVDIEVIDNETAGAVVLESGGDTLLIRDDPDTAAVETTTDDYTIRLTRQPEAGTNVEVAILTDGQADVVAVGGLAVSYQAIGGLLATQLYDGQATFVDQAGLGVITRGEGVDSGSFVDEGFSAGDLIRVSGSGGIADGDFEIASVSDTEIRLTTPLGVAAPAVADGVILSDLTRQAIFNGTVSVEENPDNGADRLVRADAGSWLGDGFLEGQRVRITDAANPAQFVDAKIAIIRGDNESLDDKLEFTLEVADLPAWLSAGPTAVEVTRIAIVVNFNDLDWFQPQTITLAADADYEVPSTREGVKVFAAQAHLVSRLQGPLAVEGGVTGADRSLSNGIKLPGESDDLLFAIGAQAPESQQIDVLNIYNDSSQQNTFGTMTETTLTGYNMAADLDLGPAAENFGEPAIFPGGISFGQISNAGGEIGTDSSVSSLEVVNLFLGEGNDRVDVLGTLNPASPVAAFGQFEIVDPAADGATIFREGFDWKAQGFLVGQSVQIDGLAGSWTVTAIDDFDANPGDGVGADPSDNSLLVLAGGPALAAQSLVDTVIRAIDAEVEFNGRLAIAATAVGANLTRASGDWSEDGFLVGHLVNLEGEAGSGQWRLLDIVDDGRTLVLEGESIASAADAELLVFVQGRHGGLTTLHGGGNSLLQLCVDLLVENAQSTINGTTTITRLDGLDWNQDQFKPGQFVQVVGENGTREILAIVDAADGIAPQDAFSDWGSGSTLILAGDPLDNLGTLEDAKIHVAEPFEARVTGKIELSASKKTPLSTLSFAIDWAAQGFFVGQEVFISGVPGTSTVVAIDGETMTVENEVITKSLSGVEIEVWGYDQNRDGGILVGGDHFVVTGGAGPDSPLVIYGDTSQDGNWYAGEPHSVLGYEFGEKPFDPFPKLADGENEDDEFVFPLANPFGLAGNDIIDASALFAELDSADLPTIGITAYGGAGNDLILGSQTRRSPGGGLRRRRDPRQPRHRPYLR